MRMRFLVFPAVAAGFLAGCSQPIQLPGEADPFGYMKKSAVCKVSGPEKTGDQLTASMAVRSDGGLCQISVSKPGGGPYASFGVSPSPEHGKAFFYNLGSRTVIAYTPTMGYAGTDKFTAILIPGGDLPRQTMQVTATVDTAGTVPVVAAPAVVAPAPVAKAPVAKSKTTHKTTTAKKSKQH